MKAVDAYLFLSGAVLIAWGIIAAVTVISASFNGWYGVVPVNNYGEGVIELLLTIGAVPGIIILCSRTLSSLWAGVLV